MRKCTTRKLVVTAALSMALLPQLAYAATASLEAIDAAAELPTGREETSLVVYNSGVLDEAPAPSNGVLSNTVSTIVDVQSEQARTPVAVEGEVSLDAEAAARALRTKVLAYNREDIDAIGCQNESGHTTCCPSFSCAYADAVLDGTVNDHSYYVCYSCCWTDWGGGGSWDRSVGGDEDVLREAYYQISAGKPTVVHVRGEYTSGHWIALIGFVDAVDPDHLDLSNFIALDPTDGQQINAAERYVLYGDGLQHISER